MTTDQSDSNSSAAGFGLDAEEAVAYIQELGDASLLSSTIGLSIPGINIAVWKLDRFAMQMVPTNFHLLGFGLVGHYEGTQMFDRLQDPPEIVIAPGSVFYVPNGQSVLSSGFGDVICLNIMLEHALMQEILSGLLHEKATPDDLVGFNRRALPRLTTLATKIFRELTLAEDGFETIIASVAKLLAFELVRDRIEATSGQASVAADGLSDEWIARIVTLIEGQLNVPPTTNELSRELGLGVTLIENGFRSVVGQTISDYVLWARINRAFAMLSLDTVPADDIAKAIGFKSETDINTVFKEYLGYGIDAVRPGSLIERM